MNFDFELYDCHKTVHAAQIVSVVDGVAGSVIVKNSKGATATITPNLNDEQKKLLIEGAWVVRYNDQYMSVSPEGAFKDGYRIRNTEPTPEWLKEMPVGFVCESRVVVMRVLRSDANGFAIVLNKDGVEVTCAVKGDTDEIVVYNPALDVLFTMPKSYKGTVYKHRIF